MTRVLQYSITEEYEHKTILDFLQSRGYSHTIIAHLKRTENGICLNEEWRWVKDKLKTGDLLTVTLIEDSLQKIIPTPLHFDVVFEDPDLLVINKPAGIPIHPSQGHHEDSLANGVIYYFKEKKENITFRCINRLDKDTSGLLIIATNMLSASRLSSMMKQRLIHREYLAICEGFAPDSGTITAPIGRNNHSTIERCVDTVAGDYACTHYKRLAYHNDYSLVSLTLDTGRTHQIRVHMKHIGHPLPGDFLYNPTYTKISRQALHSHRLTFTHPITEEPLSFTAKLPSDMLAIIHENSRHQ